jgi:peptide chain release factor 1
VNTTNSAVRLTHLPTKLSIRVETERSQKQNRETALCLLRARLLAARTAAVAGAQDASRRQQAGSGERGDKVRTLRFQDGVVTDHRTNKKIRLKDYLEGNFDFRE